MRLIQFVLLVLPLFTFLIYGCGEKSAPQSIESNGWVKQDENGEVQRVTAADYSIVCENQFCEPNYVYYATFGKPKPKPTPTPTPTPTPGPAEKLDYSRTILRMNDAWAISEGSEDVVVAIVDTGVDYNHPDLKNIVWVNEAEANGTPGVDDDRNGFVDDVHGWDFVNNKPNGMDDNKHGTHVAGIIAAEKNNFGTRGIAPHVRVMALKFLNGSGSGDTADAIKAINYAVANGAKIISNSWGGGGSSVLLDAAIQNARDKGVLVVAAAGNNYHQNNDKKPFYPANYEGVIAVGSTDSGDGISSFSNIGAKTVMLFAPGSTIYSTLPGNSYGELSGTSMAAPQVSGALALGLSVNHDASEEVLKTALCDSSVKIHTAESQCGRMDVASLLEILK